MKNLSVEQDEYLSKNFEEVNLSQKKLENIVFDGCTFTKCDFSESTLYKCKFIDCDFIKCNLSLVSLDYSKFSEVVFTECKMIGLDWTKADWPGIIPCSPISFDKCILNDSSFFGLELKEITIESSKLFDVDFKEANLSGGSFEYSDLAGSLFANTNLEECNFIEAKNYNIDINFNRIKSAKFTRYDAIALLESLDIILED